MMQDILEPRCHMRSCKHFAGFKSDDDAELNQRPVCSAFPDGIPDTIAYGRNLHINPFPGDRGIQYEKGEIVFREVV